MGQCVTDREFIIAERQGNPVHRATEVDDMVLHPLTADALHDANGLCHIFSCIDEAAEHLNAGEITVLDFLLVRTCKRTRL